MKPVKFKHYRYMVQPGSTILIQDDFTSLHSMNRQKRAYTNATAHKWVTTTAHKWVTHDGSKNKQQRVISQGGITLAYDQYEEGDEQVRVAFSVCSIEDNFDKTTGREQSEWRLNGVGRLYDHSEALPEYKDLLIPLFDICHRLSATIPVKELEAMLAVKNDANQLKAVMRLIDWHTNLE